MSKHFEDNMPSTLVSVPKNFTTVMQGMSEHFAVHMWLNEEEDFGPFWEPYDTGAYRYATREEAVVEAKEWAEREGMECRV